ncbi:MAG: GNAT family N-acetyltransferase [Proteobacteria bacterium]|jgi:ribosomal protein S18 acetylase RimI-like enzyme|nr:GNAT family N-acetyltransferase [Alphaproteobacteria bacterium]NCC03680.1 GNAT family N-acetyltransferase [Pseudomonadota bacterium]
MSVQPSLQEQNGYYKRLKSKAWLDVVEDLHIRIHSEIPQEHKHALLPRTRSYFQELLTGNNGALWGVFDEETNNLVGMCAVQLCPNWVAAKVAGRITYPDLDGYFWRLCAEDRVAVIQSLGVLRSSHGKRMAQGLIQDACLWAYSQQCTHVFAQIAQDNNCSWAKFVRQGFSIVADWKAGHPRYMLYRELSPHMFMGETAMITANTRLHA